MLRVKAYAKVNLTLEVLGRRPDGYHEIRSVMQTIDLSDELALEASPEVVLVSDIPSLQSSDNLALKAAILLREKCGVKQGARITLRKGISAAAGLGGGSADAAATLKGLSELWGLGLSQESLMELGASLGSDVPFFIFGGTALAKGRGEKVEPLRRCSPFLIVLFTPRIEMPQKTATLYARLKPEHYTKGEKTDVLAEAIARGDTLQAGWLFNVFEKVADEIFPSLKLYRSAFLEAGAQSVLLAGSGPSLFSLVPSPEEGQRIVHTLRLKGMDAKLLRSCS